MTAAVPWGWPGLTAAPESATNTAQDVRFGGGGGPTEYETVYIARSLPEGHVVKGRLEADDIPVLLRYETLGLNWGVTATTHGVEVRVPAPLVDRARSILSAPNPLRRRLAKGRRFRRTPRAGGESTPPEAR